jgi:carboxyl-terminal processing protease
MTKKYWKSAVCLIVGSLLGILATVQIQAADSAQTVHLPLEQMQQLARVFAIIRSDYVKPVDDKKLIKDAISGMVHGLDPHSVYLDKKALKEFQEGTSGRFVGIGIEIASEDGLVKVVSPIEGSPAFRAGLRSGDLIIKIDATAVRGLSLMQAVKRMRGEPKTKVVLTVMRKSENRSFPVTLIREEIKVRSVRSKLIEPAYAWLRVSQFQSNTLLDLSKELQTLAKHQPTLKGLVLDLRNNPGGLLDGAVGLSSVFLPPSVTVVSTKGQLPQSMATYRTYAAPGTRDKEDKDDMAPPSPLAQAPELFKRIPLILLVNEGSASASEIVAGALQDYHRATIMGSQTFGKGSVQVVRPVGLDAALKLTIAHYYTPLGRSIQVKGIEPDVWVDETEEGDLFGALRTREGDLEQHLDNPQRAAAMTLQAQASRQARQEIALKKLEEEAKKPNAQRKLPEYGVLEKDWQLRQALNLLKGLPVKTVQIPLDRRTAEEKDDKNKDGEE